MNDLPQGWPQCDTLARDHLTDRLDLGHPVTNSAGSWRNRSVRSLSRAASMQEGVELLPRTPFTVDSLLRDNTQALAEGTGHADGPGGERGS